MHFNAFSSVLFEKNASNKLTSGGGGQFLACRSQQNMMKYDQIIIKIPSKYHQNIITPRRDIDGFSLLLKFENDQAM